MSVSERDIPSLEYLRVLAGLSVVWHHATIQIDGLKDFISGEFGFGGIDIFFCISGFIIIYKNILDKPTAGYFLRRRLTKILSLYWLFLLLVVFTYLFLPNYVNNLRMSFSTVIMSFLFIPHYSLAFPDQIWPILVPGWTLNIEMLFYGLVALALLLSRDRAWAISLVSLLVLAGLGAMLPSSFSPVLTTVTNPLLLEFAAGGVLGWLYARERWRPSIMLGIALLFAGAAMLVGAFAEDVSSLSLRIVGATLMVAGALSPALQCRPQRLLLALGAATYAIYLSHLFTLGLQRAVWRKLLGPVDGAFEAALFMAVALVASAVVGYLVYRLIEAPLLQRLHRL